MVQDHLPLAERLVRERLRVLPGHVQANDLRSAAALALVTSALRYDPARGVTFACFAMVRIRGALTDELRSWDWAPRSLRSRARRIQDATRRLEAELRRPPRLHELAADVDMDPTQLRDVRSRAAWAPVSLGSVAHGGGPAVPVDPSSDPVAQVLEKEELMCLHQAVELLPSRLRWVVTSHFLHERPMTQIAARTRRDPLEGVAVVSYRPVAPPGRHR